MSSKKLKLVKTLKAGKKLKMVKRATVMEMMVPDEKSIVQ